MYLFQKLKYDYKHIDISDINKATVELGEFIKDAIREQPDFICFDTETTGLHIIKDKPFLVSIGFNKHVRTFDYEPNLVNNLWKMIRLSGLQTNENYIGLFAHNAKYDYHILENGGSPIYDDINIYDSITVARLTEYCDDKESMSLEHLGEKYVDDTSKFAGKIIKKLIQDIRKERKDALKVAMIDAFPSEKFSTITKKGEVKPNGRLNELLKSYDDTRVQFLNDDDPYFKFIDENYKEPNYEDVYKREKELMLSYAADDVVIMIEYLNKSLSTLRKIDKDLVVLKREGELIKAVACMENTGFKVDVDYVLRCRKEVLKYKELLYTELFIYTGEDFTVGQHEFIKKLIKNNYGYVTEKADLKALKYIRDNTDNEELKCVVSNRIELRTVDKWLSTYIDGKLNAVYNGRIYTDINNSGAVSGRVSCDMQQQPKEGLYDRDGNELFHPRNMFVCDDGYYLAFIDQSQMELRIQAQYTVLYSSEPDLGLCRAYIPYKCYRVTELGDRWLFDLKNPYDIKTFEKFKWFKLENDEIWTPTDLHSETTRHAFPNIPIDSAEFKKKRKLGKRCNFLKVYEGGVNALQESLEVDRETAEALDSAFYKAFPRIKDYQEKVVEDLTTYGFVENLYGRRYYMNNSRLFYKACNYLIQGTCADMMKDFEIKIHKYLKKNKLKSRMVLPIHDEIVVAVAKDELHVIDDVKAIMEDVADKVPNIKMIAEPEISTTCWREKKEYNKEEFVNVDNK